MINSINKSLVKGIHVITSDKTQDNLINFITRKQATINIY